RGLRIEHIGLVQVRHVRVARGEGRGLGVEIHAEQVARVDLVIGHERQELVFLGVESSHGGGSITGLPGWKQTGVCRGAQAIAPKPERFAMLKDAESAYRTISV